MVSLKREKIKQQNKKEIIKIDWEIRKLESFPSSCKSLLALQIGHAWWRHMRPALHIFLHRISLFLHFFKSYITICPLDKIFYVESNCPQHSLSKGKENIETFEKIEKKWNFMYKYMESWSHMTSSSMAHLQSE